MNSILNSAFIRQRRLELGISQREFARRLHVSPPTVTAIERGANHHALSLQTLMRIANSLGTQPAQLFPPAEEIDPTADDVRLEAALIASRGRRPASHLAEVLGWTTSRLDQTAETLATRLLPTGALLARTRAGLQIQPRPDILNVPIPDAHTTRRTAKSGRTLSTIEGRILAAAIRNGHVSNREVISNASRVATAGLLKRGFVVLADTGMRPSPAVAQTFTIVDAATRTRRTPKRGERP